MGDSTSYIDYILSSKRVFCEQTSTNAVCQAVYFRLFHNMRMEDSTFKVLLYSGGGRGGAARSCG